MCIIEHTLLHYIMLLHFSCPASPGPCADSRLSTEATFGQGEKTLIINITMCIYIYIYIYPLNFAPLARYFKQKMNQGLFWIYIWWNCSPIPIWILLACMVFVALQRCTHACTVCIWLAAVLRRFETALLQGTGRSRPSTANARSKNPRKWQMRILGSSG